MVRKRRIIDNGISRNYVSRIAAYLHVIVLIQLTFLQRSALATSFAPQSISQMTERSDLIVRARPVANSEHAAWDENHHFIVTRYTFQVLETLYGDPPSGGTIVVEQFGGFIEADGVGLVVPGSPVIRPEEEIVLFLWIPPGAAAVTQGAENSVPYEGSFRVLDLALGKFEVVRKEHQIVLTRRDVDGVELQDDGAAVNLDLDVLRATVGRVQARRDRSAGAEEPPSAPHQRSRHNSE